MNYIPKLISYLQTQHIQIKHSITEMLLRNLPIRWYCSLCFFCFLPLYIFASMKLIYNSYTILKVYYSVNDRTNYMFTLQTIHEKVKVKRDQRMKPTSVLITNHYKTEILKCKQLHQDTLTYSPLHFSQVMNLTIHASHW